MPWCCGSLGPGARPGRTWPSCRCTVAAPWCRLCSRRSAASRAAGWRSPASSRAAPSRTASSTSPASRAWQTWSTPRPAAQRRQALRQTEGALGKLYAAWRQRMIAATALVEAAIDFSDQADVASDAAGKARTEAETLQAEITRHLDDGHRGEVIRDGFRVVLAGPPNVGKSSLLNALARRDVAIVSEEAGTTRDVIEVRLDLEGLPIVVSDTAGIREAAGTIEQEGIRRTLGRAKDADLVLWMVDATNLDAPAPAQLEVRAERMLVVVNKFDLLDSKIMQPLPEGAIAVSALTGFGMERLTCAWPATPVRAWARRPRRPQC